MKDGLQNRGKNIKIASLSQYHFKKIKKEAASFMVIIDFFKHVET
jgi:hypothetical protein